MHRGTLGLTLLSATAALASASCGSDALLGPDATQGIEGMVWIGPQCPVQSAEDPCPDLPYEATIEIREHGGALVTRLRSGEDGAFRVGLRAGRYRVVPQPGDPFPSASEQEVVVPADVYVEVTVSYDTGIR